MKSSLFLCNFTNQWVTKPLFSEILHLMLAEFCLRGSKCSKVQGCQNW